jgi:hypothetical protein
MEQHDDHYYDQALDEDLHARARSNQRSMSVTVAMISAPMTVRPTEPHPPVTALPPTRIAAIASNV